jgi:hypothetical protein
MGLPEYEAWILTICSRPSGLILLILYRRSAAFKTILPHLKPDDSNPHPYFSKIDFNIILPSTPRSFEWYRFLRFANQNCLRIPHLPVRAIYPANLTLLDLLIKYKDGWP